jgi:hypothetical protein
VGDRATGMVEQEIGNKGGEMKHLFDLFVYFAFTRHMRDHHNSDYEVCKDWLCRNASILERYAWYGGREWEE